MDYISKNHLGAATTTTTNTKRPEPTRQNTENLLSYYESSIPNESQPSNPPQHQRTLSSGSTSSSDYSDNDNDNTDTTGNDTRDGGSETTSSSINKRLNTPSKGGGDRRRMAIVEMSTTGTEKGSLRQRRNLSGLALVAPPDAAICASYTRLTPPSTAPLDSSLATNQSTLYHTSSDRPQTHHRSSSEIISRSPSYSARRGSSTTSNTSGLLGPQDTSRWRTRDNYYNNKTNPPLSASPTTFLSPYPNTGSTMIDILSPIVTPEIGHTKEIHVPVAGPVVVELDKSFAEKSREPESTDKVSPRIHGSTSPPRAIDIDAPSAPPPRPPRLNSPAPPRKARPGDRDLDSVKQALQLPHSVTSALSSRTTSASGTMAEEPADDISLGESNEGGSKLLKTRSVHRREAASATLSASTGSASASSASSSPRTPPPHSTTIITKVAMEGPSPKREFEDVVVEPPTPSYTKPTSLSHTQQAPKVDHSKFDRWLTENAQLAAPSSRRRGSIDDSHLRDRDRSSSPPESNDLHYATDVPSPPSKSLKQSITKNLKRFSALPRTPSLSSRSSGGDRDHRRLSSEARYSSRTPSPRHSGDAPPPTSYRDVVRPTSFRKKKSLNPAALFCHEVNTQTTTIQRCYIYAAKINELYLYDCGLEDWIKDMKEPSIASQPLPRGPSTMPFTHHPRQTSRSSIMSEATFPRRPDATTATDLSGGGYRDITPPTSVPQLPYPALAVNPPRSTTIGGGPARSTTSISSGTPPSSVRSLAPSISLSTNGLGKAGFFASLGRKASLSKKERPVISSPVSSAPGARLPLGIRNTPSTSGSGQVPASPLGPPSVAISRPIQITSPPLVPGGPRAPPQRAKRSQTFMSSVSPTSTAVRGREEGIGRRPSLHDLGPVIDIRADPDFTKQVDKLAALIPRADRNILAGYLRRAGSDMLAIGQYLEDERMGTIRRF